MTSQSCLFPEARAPRMPEGFRYQEELISAADEARLAAELAALALKPYEFRGFLANRKVTAFGFRYDYTTGKMLRAPELPPFLVDLRAQIAVFAGRPPEDFAQVLVTEYEPGTALGWHRDRLQYGEIVGVSLLSAANFRLRRRTGEAWLRAARIVEPRSVYGITGEARMLWEHSIPSLDAMRYSLTFRTLAKSLA